MRMPRRILPSYLISSSWTWKMLLPLLKICIQINKKWTRKCWFCLSSVCWFGCWFVQVHKHQKLKIWKTHPMQLWHVATQMRARCQLGSCTMRTQVPTRQTCHMDKGTYVAAYHVSRGANKWAPPCRYRITVGVQL